MNEAELREKVIGLLDNARATSSSNPPGSSPEGFGGAVRADAEVTAILCRRFLANPAPSVTIDDGVVRKLLEQINNLNSVSMHWIVWGRLEEEGETARLVEARIFPTSGATNDWISLGRLDAVLRKGLSW